MALLLLAVSARAGGIGAFTGKLASADFGDATTYGVKMEASFFKIIGLEIRGSYTKNFDLDKPLLEDFELFSAEAGLLLRLPIGPFISMYGGGGGGYHIMPEFDIHRADGSTFTSHISDTPGAYGLAGIEAGVANFRVFAEVKYLSLKPDTVRFKGESDRLTKIETDLSGPAVHVGLLIRW
jgi:hypothetical protein